jgi:phospholipid/cholesterol/gamma-HCH transport system permease protein
MAETETPAKTTAVDVLAARLGKSTRQAVEQLGSIGIFFWKNFVHFPKLLSRFDILGEQMLRVGIGSLPIVALIGAVTGMIIAWQFSYLVKGVVPLSYLGAAVVKAAFTAMGPTFTSMILAGRVSAKLASELGTMKVTEQMDAMQILSMDVFFYLFAPRILAGFLMTMVLFVFASTIMIFSAQLLATAAFGLSPMVFYNSMRILFKYQDVFIMLVKGFVYGGILSGVGCYYGYITTGGAVGVGESTKNAVVASCVLVLMVDVVVNQLLM